MSKFKKGQLVVVWDRDDCNKFIRIFVSTMHVGNRGELFECRLPDDATGILPVELWEHCVPLEEVEPGAFLSCDRELVDSLQNDRERQYLQIQWLCEQLDRLSQDSGHCMLPSVIPSDDSCRVGGCESCWEEASLKAVEGDKDE